MKVIAKKEFSHNGKTFSEGDEVKGLDIIALRFHQQRGKLEVTGTNAKAVTGTKADRNNWLSSQELPETKTESEAK